MARSIVAINTSNLELEEKNRIKRRRKKKKEKGRITTSSNNNPENHFLIEVASFRAKAIIGRATLVHDLTLLLQYLAYVVVKETL